MKRRLVLCSIVGLAVLAAVAAPAASARPVPATTLSQQAKIVAGDATQRDYFGHSVAISADGTIALSGAWGRGRGTGTVYAFSQSGGDWTQQQRLSPSDPENGDQYGSSVAVSADGTTAVAGAESKAGSAGAVYVFTRSGSVWTQQQELTASDAAAGIRFGSSVGVSADGNTAIVGARGNGLGTGAAYVFTRSGSVWTQQQKLTASDAAAGDSFGTSVATSSDGSTALAGASGKAGYKGAAYAFTRSGTVWSQQAKLTATNGLAADAFGGHVALSSNGSVAFLSAAGKLDNTGSVYQFTRSGSVWTQAAEVMASDDGAGDTLGSSVSTTDTGGVVLAGADGDEKYTGAAYVFIADVGPVIGSFKPKAGKVGASTTLTGDRFTGATSVTFNGTPASFTVDNDNQIRATVPSDGTTGKIAVTTPGGTAQTSKAFKVKPVVASFTPGSGTVGTPVTISGSGLLDAIDVEFNGTVAAFTVVDSGTITTTVPAGATSGKITVTNAGGTVKSKTSFHVTT